MEILPIEHSRAIDRVLYYLSLEKAIVFPTDTVYGLGTDAFSTRGIESLYQIKGRDFQKAIPVLIGSFEQLSILTDGLDPFAEKLSRAFWPGPLTLILRKGNKLPKNISPYPTIGVRMPNHDFVLSLLRTFGPLATTSANISGSDEAVSVKDVLEQFKCAPDLILDGGFAPVGIPSTIVDCSSPTPKIIRSGSLSMGELSSYLQISS